MVRGSSPTDAGPIYYWLAIHSENLEDSQQAADWYEKAVKAFGDIGHEKRQGRTYANLGSVRVKLGNHLPAMEAFERAIALNPKDGIAHVSIAG